jgi:phosphoserine phosphatase RsbU/P
MEILTMSEVHTDPSMNAARLLVADDQAHIVTALEMLLTTHGYQIDSTNSPAGVMEALRRQAFDVILMDLNYTRDTTGGAEGLELVSSIRAMDQAIPLVVMTAWGSVGLAVEAMRRGASDFIQKPWNNHELLEKVREQVEHCRTLRSSQKRQEEETAEAREIQKSLLPSVLPQIAGYDIAAVTQPMHFIGGDYYNIVSINETQTAFCIADVAGKGLPGALLMSNLQAALKPLIREDVQPNELCNRLNRTLCDIMPANKFISFFYGVLDGESRKLTFCNAGHNPPLLVRTNGTSCELAASGAILGQFANWQYSQTELELSAGDKLLLFTDGLVEAFNENGEPFGEERLIHLLRSQGTSGAAAMQDALLREVSSHCGGKFQDDATLIVLRA